MGIEALRVAAKESRFMKFILGGFIFLAVGGLVFTDVRGYFSGGAVGTTVARVSDTKIDIREFDSQLRGFLRQTGLTAEQAYDAGLINAYLNSYINNILQLKSAEDLNIRLDNKLVAQKLMEIFKGMSKDEIEENLKSRGISESEMANSIRTQVVTDIIAKMPVVVTDYTPSYVLDAQKRIDSEQRSGDLYKISLKKLAGDINITDADILDYYKSNQSKFIVPEARKFTVGKMTASQAKSGLVKITADDAQSEYKSRKDDFYVAEKRSIVQMMVTNPDDAQDIYEMAMDTGDLKKSVSNITGSTDAYRGAETFDAKGMLDELSEAAFGSNVNVSDVTPPVKTVLGYVVMQVLEIKKGAYQPFDDVKVKLVKQMKENAVYDALYNKIVDAEDMVDTGASFDKIVKELNLKTSSTSDFTKLSIEHAKGDLKKYLDTNPSLIDELFALNEGNASYPIELGDDAFILVGVKSITVKSVLPLDDVKSDIKTTLTKSRIKALGALKVAEIVDGLNNESLKTASVTKEFKAKKSKFSNVKRDNKIAYVETVFTTDLNKFSYAFDGSNAVILKVLKSKFDKKQKDTDIASMKSSQKRTINSLNLDYYRSDVDVDINERLLKQTYSGDVE